MFEIETKKISKRKIKSLDISVEECENENVSTLLPFSKNAENDIDTVVNSFDEHGQLSNDSSKVGLDSVTILMPRALGHKNTDLQGAPKDIISDEDFPVGVVPKRRPFETALSLSPSQKLNAAVVSPKRNSLLTGSIATVCKNSIGYTSQFIQKNNYSAVGFGMGSALVLAVGIIAIISGIGVTRAEDRGAKYHLSTAPSSADVFINGKKVGNTGGNGIELYLEPRDLSRIRLEKKGYLPYELAVIGLTGKMYHQVTLVVPLQDKKLKQNPAVQYSQKKEPIQDRVNTHEAVTSELNPHNTAQQTNILSQNGVGSSEKKVRQLKPQVVLGPRVEQQMTQLPKSKKKYKAPKKSVHKTATAAALKTKKKAPKRNLRWKRGKKKQKRSELFIPMRPSKRSKGKSKKLLSI